MDLCYHNFNAFSCQTYLINLRIVYASCKYSCLLPLNTKGKAFNVALTFLVATDCARLCTDFGTSITQQSV